jgi:hypothetical protein
MNAVDPNIVFERLRAETCKLLGFNIDALDAWQTAKVDTLSLLRLEQDRQMSAALRGEAVDPRQIAAIGEQLERLLHPAAAVERGRAGETARDALRRLILDVHAADEHKRADIAREEQQAIAEASGVQPTPALTASAEQTTSSSNVKHEYIDAEVLNEPLPPAPPPAEPSPLKPIPKRGDGCIHISILSLTHY